MGNQQRSSEQENVQRLGVVPVRQMCLKREQPKPDFSRHGFDIV